MLPKIIRTGIHRCEGTGVRKTKMATQYRKAYVPVTLDVDKEGAILPRLIWWDNGVIFQIDQILYKCRASSNKVGDGGIRYTVAVPTFTSYSTTVKKIIAPYFREKEVTLKNLTAKDIQEFYLSELERVSPSSVIHYHANIHKALKYAVKIDLIDVNPADKVERPKKDRYVGSFYDADEVNALFEAAKGSKLELPILFGAFYGLRRSEAIGLKWDAIDFDQNTITIRHTVTSCDLDGKRVLVASDTTKTKSSMRTLPLVPFMRERLLALKEEQQENRRLCGRSYIKEYLEYVCVNEIGDLIKPHYVTESFPKLLKAKGMRQIRYHDLRHSCASLLLANGVPMKQIQEWLGHSDFSTTANIYAHLDYSSKLTSADAMLNGLGFAQN